MRKTVIAFVLSCGLLRAQNPFGSGSSEMHATSDLQSNGAVLALISPVKGQPYSANKVTHSVWKLGDGTTIRHDSSSEIDRDGEGRVREVLQHTVAQTVGGKQINRTSDSVTVTDPTDHSIMTWQDKPTKIAVRMEMPDFSALAAHHSEHPEVGGLIGGIAPPPGPPGHGPHIDVSSKDNVHTEDLGQQSLAGGILATGKRTTTVIPIGQIGNDQPITLVHEEWYSSELKIVVKSIDSDPRSGERTMELEGLNRGEPDAALFHAPAGYTVKDMGQMLNGLGNLGKPTPKPE